MSVAVSRRLFTVDEYYRMAEAGIFTEDDRVELIEGEILTMPAIGSPHASCVDRLNRLATRRVGRWAIVRVRNPVHLGPLSEPEPDVVLALPRDDEYALSHPGPAEILLIVEVADTTLPFDRDTKMPLYARSGVPEAWIVNLPEALLELYRNPTADGYREVRLARPGEMVAPVALPRLRLAVATLLGRPATTRRARGPTAP